MWANKYVGNENVQDSSQSFFYSLQKYFYTEQKNGIFNDIL